jgi:hypothetical protein
MGLAVEQSLTLSDGGAAAKSAHENRNKQSACHGGVSLLMKRHAPG